MSDRPDHLSYALAQMENARMRLKNVEELMSDEDSEFDIATRFNKSNIIHDCQICIELYAKVIFKAVDVNPEKRHKIDFENAGNLLKRNFPDGFEDERRLPRVIFLSRFWREFYEDSKYGQMELNIAPDRYLRKKDAERAKEDAEFCREVAEDLVDAAKEEYESKEENESTE